MKEKQTGIKEKASLLGTKVAGVVGIKGKDTTGMKTKGGSVKAAADDMIDNPLKKVVLTSSLEDDCKTEADVIREALLAEDEIQKKRELRELDKRIVEERQQQEDTEYFACIVFESRSQKDAFLAAMGWTAFGNKYINGLHLARKQNITLPTVKLKDEKGGKTKMYSDIIDRNMK